MAENQYRIRLNSPTVLRLQTVAAGVTCDYMELGDPGIPHAVVMTDLTQDRAALRELARKLRSAAEFPRGANVNLYCLEGENRVRLLTFERGVEDFTLACGTGNGATAAALTLRGLVSGRQVELTNDGGRLLVDITSENGAVEIFLTGPADFVFTGETA